MKIDKNKIIINIDVIAADTLETTYDNHTTQMVHPDDTTKYISDDTTKYISELKSQGYKIIKDWLIGKLKSPFDDVSLRRILNNKLGLYIYIYI